MRVVQRIMIGDAGNTAMQIAAAQILRTHHLTGGGPHQRRPAQEDGALLADNDALVGHRGHIGAPAVQDPITTAICAIPAADILA